MQHVLRLLPALALVLSGAPGAAGVTLRGEHPIGKVIGLLQGLIEKVKQEGQDEELTYAKFSHWCSNSAKTLEKAVTEDKEAIDTLTSKVDAKTTENATLTEQITKLNEEILKYTLSGDEAEKARTDANALYTKADADFESTIKAFEDAITALSDAKASTSSFAQAKVAALGRLPAAVLAQLSEAQAQRLQGAVQTAVSEPKDSYYLLVHRQSADPPASGASRPDFLAKGDYDSHVKKYSFKSDNIVELLKELKASFEDQRVEATKAETNSVNAYNLAKDALSNALEAAKSALGEKETARGDAQTELATAKASLIDEQADLEADTGKLEATKQDCEMKRSEWEERSAIRAKEVKAMEVGVEILAKVSGVRTEAPTNPVLPPSPLASEGNGAGAFLQTDPRTRALTLLKREAARLHVASFTKFTNEVAAKIGGPFDDVNNMIEKMIFRLMAEQTDEDEHKNWCDLEVQKTNTSKLDKEEKIVELDTKLEQAKGSVAALTEEIQAADDKVAEIIAFLEEATTVRAEGKKENEAAIKDAKAAQEALAKATVVIEQFYKDSGAVKKEAWEFIQRAPVDLPEKPETWAASYTGVADPAAQPEGIIAVLKEISAEFAQMEADTMAQEETDQKNYQEEVKNSEIEKARRAKESEMKAQEKGRLVEKIAELEKSKKHTQQEHAAVEQYLKDLAPACLEGDSTYEDRKAARAAEVSALKEAQVILQSAFDAPAATTPYPAALLLKRIKPVRFF